MKVRELINEIDAMCEVNRQHKRDANELLCDIRNYLSQLERGEIKSDAYVRGAEDAWELARNIFGDPDEGAYTRTDIDDIFGVDKRCCDVIQDYTYEEALANVKAYEQKKKEEAEPVFGDVVICEDGYGTKLKGIFLNEGCTYFTVLGNLSHEVHTLGKDIWKIAKTGKHFDIQGMLDEIKTED